MNSQISKDIQVTSTGEQKTHQAFAVELSRLRKEKDNCENNNVCAEFNRLGGQKRFIEVENLVKRAKNANYQEKKTGMDAGRQNQFIRTHEKDRDNANPTKAGGLPQVTKGDVSRKIMSNQEVYNEAYINELSEIRYLIEYMDNNKKQKL